MNKWKEIWNKRKSEESEIKLETLLKADGFDIGAGNLDQENWLEFLEKIQSQIIKESCDSIFEIGCGSGAFLYHFYKQEHKVAGLDYSEPLIELAQKAMPNMQFEVAEAINLNTSEKYDSVVSFGVFHYFENLNYADEVLNKMFLKSNKIIAILDVNDKSKEGEYHNVRKQALSQGEYQQKYKGLNHLFYEKSWFVEFAKHNNCHITIQDQDIKNYLKSSLRFNVIMEKI